MAKKTKGILPGPYKVKGRYLSKEHELVDGAIKARPRQPGESDEDYAEAIEAVCVKIRARLQELGDRGKLPPAKAPRVSMLGGKPRLPISGPRPSIGGPRPKLPR